MVVLEPPATFVMFAVLPVALYTPNTSQSPAVREMLVILVGVLVVRETVPEVEVMSSPTLPVAALLPLVTPTMFGVVMVGDVASVTEPEPVLAVAPVPPFPTGRVPVTPVVSGRPVALVSTRAEGVPSAGVTNVGDVARTTDPLPVDADAPVPPCATVRGVVRPVREVMSLFAPRVAAERLVRAAVALVAPVPP